MIALTGATGGVGTYVLARLLADPRRPRIGAVVRDPRRLFHLDASCLDRRQADYGDPVTLRSAFDGVTTLILIASDGPSEEMWRHHENVVAAAGHCGVKHVVYMSLIDVGEDSPFYYASVHRATEDLLAAAGIPSTLVRTSLFTDFVLRTWVRPALRAGLLELPVREGRMSLVARDDVAACLVAAAFSGEPGVITATGPRALSIEDVCRAVTGVTGQRLAFRPTSARAYRNRLRREGLPGWLVTAYATLLASIADDRFAEVSDDVARLTGHTPRPIEDLLTGML